MRIRGHTAATQSGGSVPEDGTARRSVGSVDRVGIEDGSGCHRRIEASLFQLLLASVPNRPRVSFSDSSRMWSAITV
jgi:hypothetical protein